MNLMKNVNATILCIDKMTIKNNETGEVTVMYNVTYLLDTESYDDHFGGTILTSVAFEKSFERMRQKVGHKVKIDISEQPVFGKKNQYKKIVSLVDGVNVRSR